MSKHIVIVEWSNSLLTEILQRKHAQEGAEEREQKRAHRESGQ